MQRKTVVFSLCFLTAAFILVVARLCLVTSSDIASYKKRAAAYKAIAKESISKTATQKRQGVSKDIFFTQEDGTRLQYKIQSSASQLNLVPSGSKIDVVEQLSDIECWLQEKLFSNAGTSSQQIRYLKAESGLYSLSRQQFLAGKVKVSLFRKPGINLVLPSNNAEAFLSGSAHDVVFTVSGKEPHFEAHDFEATLQKR